MHQPDGCCGWLFKLGIGGVASRGEVGAAGNMPACTKKADVNLSGMHM